MSENDIETEVSRLRTENADLHNAVEALQSRIDYLTRPAPAGAAIPTAVLEDGAIFTGHTAANVNVAFNVDGIIWRTSIPWPDTDKVEDAQADARRFIDSAHVICAADDAAVHVERARSAGNRARQSLHIALASLAAVMPAHELKLIRRALADVEESLGATRQAYRELLDVGARQAVDLPLAPADVPVFGVHVPVEASPSTAGTARTGEAAPPAASPAFDGLTGDILANAVAIAAQHQTWLDSMELGTEG